MNHFLWSAMQAVEKYLKAILLFNAQQAPKLQHDIDNAYKLAVNIAGIGVALPPEELELLGHLHRHGLNRYREISTYTRGNELQTLDSLVWHLRRFCQPFHTSIRLHDGTLKDMFQLNVNHVHDPEHRKKPYRFRIITGYLEKVLDAAPSDLRRVNLVWGNRYYGPEKGQRFRCSHSVNSFLSRHPAEIDCLRDYIHIPKAQLRQIDEYNADQMRMTHNPVNTP